MKKKARVSSFFLFSKGHCALREGTLSPCKLPNVDLHSQITYVTSNF